MSGNETVEQLMLKVMLCTQIHSSCLMLTFKARRLDLTPNQQLAFIDGLVDGSTILVTMLRDRFPERLGPFDMKEIPIDCSELVLSSCSGADFTRYGTMWVMSQCSARGVGVDTMSAEELVAQVSPASTVTLTDFERRELNIPPETTHFCWSYQVANWDSMVLSTFPEVEALVKLGGYIYCDEARKVVQAKALMPSQDDTGGLQFRRPKLWNPSWTESLVQLGRFQPITIVELNKVGARHYCWLKPGERISGGNGEPLDSQPEVPHGGFAYLFHADPLQADETELNMDRYFAIASGDERTPAGRPSQNADFHLMEATNDQGGDISAPTLRPNEDFGAVPNEWAPRLEGLVRLESQDVLNMFSDLLNVTHKQTDNWTRDRGCRQHGVNQCKPPCIYQNKAPVPSEYILVGAWRNQNAELWSRYCAMRAAIAEECQLEPVPEPFDCLSCAHQFQALAGSQLQPLEWRLFHGSSANGCQDICAGNFKEELAGTGATWKVSGDTFGMPLYGFGIYFAEHITKADEYCKSDASGIFSVLLCRIVAGRVKIVTDNEFDPTLLKLEALDGKCHSVCGDRTRTLRKPYREVVVYESDQVYPEFLIQYVRRA